MQYLVRWEVEVDADSAEEAASQALEMQRDPNSTALYFEVAPTTNDAVGPFEIVDFWDGESEAVE